MEQAILRVETRVNTVDQILVLVKSMIQIFQRNKTGQNYFRLYYKGLLCTGISLCTRLTYL